jgi:hypothetical protein
MSALHPFRPQPTHCGHAAQGRKVRMDEARWEERLREVAKAKPSDTGEKQ